MTNFTYLTYQIQDAMEVNLCFMPFIKDGGFFIPTDQSFSLNDKVKIELQFPNKPDLIHIEGRVVWLTPKNALHHVKAGIGVQFIGPQAKTVRAQIEAMLDPGMDIGGYTYGIFENLPKK